MTLLMLAAAMAAPWDSWPVVPLAHPADAMACEIAGRTLDVQCNKDEGCLFDLALTMTGPCTDGLTLAPGATQPRAETPAGFVPWSRCDAGWCFTDLPETGTIRLLHWSPTFPIGKSDRVPDGPRKGFAVAVDLAPQHWTPLPDLVVTSDGAYKVAFSPEPYGSHLTGMSNAPFSTEFSERLGILVKPGGQRNLKEKPPSNYVTWVSPSTADRRHADSVPLKDACLKVKSMPAESDFSRRLGPSRPGVFTANSQTGPGGVVASWAPHTTPVYIGVIGPDQKLIEFVHPGDVEARVTGEARFVSPRPIGEFAVCVIPSEPADVRIRMFAN